MNENFKSAFNKFSNQYRKILKNFYPAFGNKGFEERNLTNNYVNALLASINDKEAIAWFESSLETSNEKIDAVVYSPNTKSVFFIEAKRIINNDVDRKIESINKDIERLANKSVRDQLTKKWNTKDLFNNQYIIALADVWAQKEPTNAIPKKWLDGNVINIPANSKLVYSDNANFQKFEDEFMYKTINMYNLLISIIKVF
jgi:hypothetical protein